VSQLVDASSGLHPRHSPYYVRTVRGDKKDPLTQFLIDRGVPCENDIMAPQSTVVFSFPIKSPDGAICRKDLTAVDQLEMYKKLQNEYCEHKPSITINVKEYEWLEVGAWVYKNIDEVIGVSFLPDTEHSYRQAPYQDCTQEEYNKLNATMPQTIDWNELKEYEKEDNTVGSQEYACSAGFCEIV
jgi:ribonucleoside-diphosphate reductase alpha chain